MGKWGGGEPTGVQSSLQQNVGHACGIDSLMETTQLNLWQSHFHWCKYATNVTM